MKIIKTNEFEETVKSGTVLVDFFATWCGPCKMLSPVLDEVAKELEEVSIVKVDVDDSGDLAMRFGIMSVPTMLLFKDGKLVHQMQGYQPKEALVAVIKKFI